MSLTRLTTSFSRGGRDQKEVPSRTISGDYKYRGIDIIRDDDLWLVEDSNGKIKAFPSVPKAVNAIDKAIKKAQESRTWKNNESSKY